MAQVTSEPAAGLPPTEPDQVNVEVSQQVVGRSPWELFWRRFRRDKFAIGGLILVIFMLVVALFAPVIASIYHGPNAVHLDRLDEFGIPTGPQADFLFGLDTAGRDLMVRVAYGARTSLFIAFFATGLATITNAEVGAELTVNTFAKDENADHVAHLFGDTKHTLKLDGHASALDLPTLGAEVTYAGRDSVVTSATITAANEDFVKASVSGEGYVGTGSGSYA